MEVVKSLFAFTILFKIRLKLLASALNEKKKIFEPTGRKVELAFCRCDVYIGNHKKYAKYLPELVSKLSTIIKDKYNIPKYQFICKTSIKQLEKF